MVTNFEDSALNAIAAMPYAELESELDTLDDEGLDGFAELAGLGELGLFSKMRRFRRRFSPMRFSAGRSAFSKLRKAAGNVRRKRGGCRCANTGNAVRASLGIAPRPGTANRPGALGPPRPGITTQTRRARSSFKGGPRPLCAWQRPDEATQKRLYQAMLVRRKNANRRFMPGNLRGLNGFDAAGELAENALGELAGELGFFKKIKRMVARNRNSIGRVAAGVATIYGGPAAGMAVMAAANAINRPRAGQQRPGIIPNARASRGSQVTELLFDTAFGPRDDSARAANVPSSRGAGAPFTRRAAGGGMDTPAFASNLTPLIIGGVGLAAVLLLARK